MTTSIESIKQRISDNRQKLNAEVETIRKNTNYSDYGQRDLIRAAHDKSQAEHERLVRELAHVIEDTRARLERAAFSAPIGREDVYRNAVQHASQIANREERQRAIALAQRTGDKLALRAFAAVAHESEDDPGWGILRVAGEVDPDVSKLVSFEQEHGHLRSATQKLGEAIARTAPTQPAEAKFAPSPDSSDSG